jgi:hypothetical protein
MGDAMKHLAMAIAASQRLGWIALGLYIRKMNISVVENPFYKTLIEYHRAMHSEYEFMESIMTWADEYRMVLFPGEFLKRLDAIDNEPSLYHIKERQRRIITRKAERAKLELSGAWGRG